MFGKLECSDPKSSGHLGPLDILTLDWLVHTVFSRKERKKKKKKQLLIYFSN